jgi:hypothetical protein
VLRLRLAMAMRLHGKQTARCKQHYDDHNKITEVLSEHYVPFGCV